jgi:hypothetical protein
MDANNTKIEDSALEKEEDDVKKEASVKQPATAAPV